MLHADTKHELRVLTDSCRYVFTGEKSFYNLKKRHEILVDNYYHGILWLIKRDIIVLSIHIKFTI